MTCSLAWRGVLHHAVGITAALCAFLVTSGVVYGPSARANENVSTCGAYGERVFRAEGTPALAALAICPNSSLGGGGMEVWATGKRTARGTRAIFQATAPAGLVIVGATVPNGTLLVSGVNDGSQYGGGFYWGGGSASVHDLEPGIVVGPISSRYFGFQLVCGRNPCTLGASQFDVGQITLAVRETVPPVLVAPSGLWQATGWVRGNVTLRFYGTSPSGVCGLSARIGGQLVGGVNAIRDPSVWHQCSAPTISQQIHTIDGAQGAVPLTISGWDAAGEAVSYAKTIRVDNHQPTVALSGPTSAASTAGTQYVTARATAGPSGIAGIDCAVDGSKPRWYAGATARVPVAGTGQHLVQCFSENNARDDSGARATSTLKSFSLAIRVPTITGIAFTTIADRLRCRRVEKRIKVPGRWVTVRRHHKRVRIRRRPQTKTIKITKCHPRTVIERRTVVVTIHRHGKRVRVRRRRTVRVVVPPHAVNRVQRRIAHGHSTIVDGWLGTYSGQALAGQPVTVLAAPDDGHQAFRPAAIAITRADGGWTAALSPGPSRLVEASYGGNSTLEPNFSGTVRLIVPAKVTLVRVTPRRVPWGGTVRIVGRLSGGYLPPGGALVRLRIGSGSAFTTYGVKEHVVGSGRFSTTYTFGAGEASVQRSFWFQIASLPVGDYPWAPAASRRATVIVGGHPAARCCR
jgi:hypothetical protein